MHCSSIRLMDYVIMLNAHFEVEVETFLNSGEFMIYMLYTPAILRSTWNKIYSLTQALLDMSLWESKMSQALLEEFIPADRFATLDPTMST